MMKLTFVAEELLSLQCYVALESLLKLIILLYFDC
jgi:hypothetical protein